MLFNLFWPSSYGLAPNPADQRPLSAEEMYEREKRFWSEMRPASLEQTAEYARLQQNVMPPTENIP